MMTWCLDELSPGRQARGMRELAQALYRRITTPRGTLRHGGEPTAYGIDITEYVGHVGAVVVIASRIEAELRKDDRVAHVNARAWYAAGALRVHVDVQPVEGDAVELELTVDSGSVTLEDPPVSAPEGAITSPAASATCWLGTPVTLRGTGARIASIEVRQNGALITSSSTRASGAWTATFTPTVTGTVVYTVRLVGPGGVTDVEHTLTVAPASEAAVWQLLAEYPVEMLILPHLADFTVVGDAISAWADRSRTGVVITDGVLVSEGTPRNRHLSSLDSSYKPKLVANGTEYVAEQIDGPPGVQIRCGMQRPSTTSLSGGKCTFAVHFKYVHVAYEGTPTVVCLQSRATGSEIGTLGLTAEDDSSVWYYARFPKQLSGQSNVRRKMVGVANSYQFVAVRWDKDEPTENSKNRAWRNGVEQTTYDAEWGPSGTFATDSSQDVILAHSGVSNPTRLRPTSAISAFCLVSEAIPADELNVGGRFDSLWRSILAGYG